MAEHTSSARKPNGWLYPLFMVVYAALLAAIVYGFCRLFRGQLLAIGATALGLYWGGLALTVGLEWREIRENGTVRSGVTGIVWLMAIMPFAFALCDVVLEHEKTSKLAFSALYSVFILAASYAGFGIGMLIDRRRGRRTEQVSQ